MVHPVHGTVIWTIFCIKQNIMAMEKNYICAHPIFCIVDSTNNKQLLDKVESTIQNNIGRAGNNVGREFCRVIVPESILFIVHKISWV